jgi:DNA-binding response OmpR family regulator
MRKRHPAASRRGLPRLPHLPRRAGTASSRRAGPFHILLLEDEPAVREVLAELLARTGFLVIQGGSLADGRAALENLGWNRIDLVLTDTHLSRDARVRNGFDFHAYWRARHPVPPFIFMDGWGGAATASLSASDSCQIYALAKPFSFPVLLALMHAILGHSGPSSPSGPSGKPGGPAAPG